MKLFVIVVKNLQENYKSKKKRIKEWAETNIVHLTTVCRAYKWQKP